MKIRIEDLFYLYNSDGETVVALRGLHLDVESGECLIIKGPNGSGKSTLVKLLTGFLTPSAGRILIGDTDLAKIDPLQLRRQYISSIDQRGNLLRDLTVLSNVALAFSLAGKPQGVSEKSAAELLSSHGLAHLSVRYPEQLSAGERQMCSLLAAIATEPKILIADEPSGELDNDTADVVYRLLKSAADKATVILVTHDARAEIIADRVVRIRDGRISEEWVPGEAEKSVVDPFGWKRVGEERQPASSSIRGGEQPMGVSRPSALRGENLGLRYGENTIFEQVNIYGVGGELIAVTSASGMGKSSLLRMLGGIQDPSAGNVYIDDSILGGMNREGRAALRKESIGFLSQGTGPVSKLSLRDYLGSSKAQFAAAFESRLNRPLAGFSGGERAQIELLRLLAQRKPILLLDEPTSQTDERRSAELVSLLLDYVHAGALVITSTRDEALLSCADRILTISADFRP